MPKRLIVCCDGTWNAFGQKHPTNVVKLYEAIAGADDDGVIQDSVYVAGVGTKSWQKVRGGALGLGLSKNVKKGYLELVEMYEPGDEIFLFGFSRGAYTARSIAGFIRNAGLLTRDNRGRLDEAFALYRDRDRSSAPSRERAVEFRAQYSHEVPIRFIGVWDTVGSLGIPLSGKVFEWINRRWAFHDTQLSSTVEAAYHALAIDEKRGPFKPTLWQAQPDAPDSQIIEQVWFSGVHCNVGGGYADSRISDIPLVWMMNRAREHGLAFTDDEPAPTDTSRQVAVGVVSAISRFLTNTDAFAVPLQESRKGFYRWFLEAFSRPMGAVDSGHEFVASSATRRMDEVAAYDPVNLADYRDSGGPEMAVDFHPTAI
ncbi:DUF2235 domain-containing protein [Gordonia sp. HNM0687]|uniref:DUF2235 domain-containing protein n=1 Tax=Gordonia mangrovi TaxID=2665643 RepID=A0A6L7GTX1_9ACTN|nr:DUF2235 domain-containing protein [Gordonia mangrovi]MXP23386.1 DUF2235 domain-containing protein [Gordonia mangrovi]UVF76711.1 DUF2235 domain-containing protein [Gordonia mangrovi]